MHPAVAITTALAGLFTLAIIAVVFSQKANTSSVFTSAGNALGTVIGQAVSPITGGNATNLGAQVGANLGSAMTSAGAQALGAWG